MEGGSTLSNAMRQYPKLFDDLTTNMIEAGEAGGILDTILQRLATYVEKSVKLRCRDQIRVDLPTSVISMAVLVVGALLKFVVPILPICSAACRSTCRADQDRDWIEQLCGRFWWLVVLLPRRSGHSAYDEIRKDPKGRYLFDKMLLNLPVLGMVLRKIAVARFTRTLGTLITSGVPILEGLGHHRKNFR